MSAAISRCHAGGTPAATPRSNRRGFPAYAGLGANNDPLLRCTVLRNSANASQFLPPAEMKTPDLASRAKAALEYSHLPT